MKKSKTRSIFFIGHLAIDTIIRFRKKHNPTLGGSVSFGSLSLSSYINDVKINIISNLGSLNFDKSLLDSVKKANIDLKGLKWTETNNTHFVLNYFNHSRTLFLKSKGPNLEFKDIPDEYLNNPPEVIILAPLCNEISYEYITDILKHFPNAFIAIEIQGFIRNINDGLVSIVRDKNIISNIENMMFQIGDKLILKGSEDEMKILSGKDNNYEVMDHFKDMGFEGIFIMTLGEAGSLIIKKERSLLKIPAFKSRGVIDETGAGDVYFAIFLYEFVKSDKTWESIEKAAYLASSAASFNVEKAGPYGFETKEKVLERLLSKNYIT